MNNRLTTTSFQPMLPLTSDEYLALKADVAARGVVVPLIVDQHGRLIDGYYRRQAAAELGVNCPFEVRHIADDDDALDLAVTLNAARRHLSREQRRALIRAEVKRRPGDSDRAIARGVGCSPSTVGAVRVEVSNLDTSTTMPPGEARELTDKVANSLDETNRLLLQALGAGADPLQLVGMLTGMQRHLEQAPEATPAAVANLRKTTEARITWLLDFADDLAGGGR